MKAGAVEIVRRLREHGHQAYLVGGCVRDLLLGREPADYDVSTDATPQQVMRIFPQTYEVGAQFGVVLVPVKSVMREREVARLDSDGQDGGESDAETSLLKSDGQAEEHPTGYPEEHAGAIEVATFRNDGVYLDGRHPDAVRFTLDAKEDVQRRDFTINGLMLDPLDGDRVLDFVGGEDDLRAGLVRTIGRPERRFGEDKLRMLRAVRFAARFEYEIEAETMESIRALAPAIAQVSRERVRDELTKMLTEGHASRAFELLDVSGLLHEVLPEVERMKGVAQPQQYHPEGDVWVHTLLLLSRLPAACPRTLAWGALLHDVGKPATFKVAPDRIRFDGHVEVGVRMAEEICARLRFSNDDTEQVASLVANHMRFADAMKMKESTLKRFLRLPKFDEHMELHRIDCLGSHGNLELYDYTAEKMRTMPAEEIRPKPLITGNDLIAEGYTPGPLFTEILSALEDGQLEGTLKDRESAMEFVREMYPAK